MTKLPADKPITIGQAIYALQQHAKITGMDYEAFLIHIEPYSDDEIEITDFGKYASGSSTYKRSL